MSFPIQCAECKHYKKDNKCDAYTFGIPNEVLTGEVDHTEPYKGDNGIQFEPIK